MSRLVFPDEGSRLVFHVAGLSLVLAPGATAPIFSDAAGTVPADLRAYDGTTTPGAVIPGGVLTVDIYSRLPLFWGPDGADTVWTAISGGPLTPVYARVDDRLDVLVTGAAAEVAARTSGDAANTTAITTEAATRAAADTTLTTNVATNTAGITAKTLADVATTVTASGALVAGVDNPVDATAGNLTMTLANASSAGQHTVIEKTDATTNTVTVTCNLRGSAGSVALVWAHESIELLSKADGSWWPIAGHKTKSSLDAAYVPLSGPTSPLYFKGGSPYVDVAHPAFGGVALDGSTPADAALRAADTWARTFAQGSTGIPTLVLPPGLISLTVAEFDWKSPIRGSWVNIGTTIRWDGAAGATVFVKNAVAAGGISWGGLEHVKFTPGANEPATWLDLTANLVDVGFRLREVHLAGCSGAAIKLGNWVNLHWTHLRFDSCGDFCVHATPTVAQNESSFLIEMFTYDHRRTSGRGQGLMCIDNTANASNLGPVTWRGGRIEINTALTGAASIFETILPDVAPNARTVKPRLDDVALAVAAGAGSLAFTHQTTAATTVGPSLILTNVSQNGMTGTCTGSLSSNHPVPALLSNYGYLAIGLNSVPGGNIFAAVTKLITSFGGAVTDSIRRGSEAFDRWQQDETGKQSWGGGAAALDTTLYRNAADALRTDDAFLVGEYLGLKTKSGTFSDADFSHSAADGIAGVDSSGPGAMWLKVGGVYKKIPLGNIATAYSPSYQVSGQWSVPGLALSTSNVLGFGTLRLMAYYISTPITIDQLALEITAAGTSGNTFVLTVYGDTGTIYPGSLLGSATVAADAIATPTAASSPSPVVTPGLVWIGGMALGATTQPTVRTVTQTGILVTNGTAPRTASNVVIGYTQGSLSSPPSTFAAGGSTTSVVPCVQLHAA